MTTADQPISNVLWLPHGALHANGYNPNHVAPPEMELLTLSIREDGWTQPIVATGDGQIVDGFHRWTVSDDPDVAGLTDGEVPVVILDGKTSAEQMLSTVRHNRARGAHYVVRMADIVATLLASGMDEVEIAARLGMEPDEVVRLRDRGNMLARGAADLFGGAWRPSANRKGDVDATH